MLYENIRAMCKARGLSFRKVERESGLSNNSIRRWNAIAPNVYAVKAVADYLGVTVDYLLREPESNKKAASGGE